MSISTSCGPGSRRSIVNGASGLVGDWAVYAGVFNMSFPFCDVVMPGFSGLDVLRELSSDPATRDIPIVMNTAKVLTSEERRELARAAAVLSKESYASGGAAAEIHKALEKVGFAA